MAIPQEVRSAWKDFKKNHKDPLYLIEVEQAARIFAQGAIQGITPELISQFVDVKISQSKRRLIRQIQKARENKKYYNADLERPNIGEPNNPEENAKSISVKIKREPEDITYNPPEILKLGKDTYTLDKKTGVYLDILGRIYHQVSHSNMHGSYSMTLCPDGKYRMLDDNEMAPQVAPSPDEGYQSRMISEREYNKMFNKTTSFQTFLDRVNRMNKKLVNKKFDFYDLLTEKFEDWRRRPWFYEAIIKRFKDFDVFEAHKNERGVFIDPTSNEPSRTVLIDVDSDKQVYLKKYRRKQSGEKALYNYFDRDDNIVDVRNQYGWVKVGKVNALIYMLKNKKDQNIL